MAGSGKQRGEHGSAGLLALILASAFAGIGWFGLSPALSHAEVIAAQATLQSAGQQLIVSSPATTAHGRHQCYRHAPELDPLLRATSVCECERKGVRFWADAARKDELGCIVSPAIAERYYSDDDDFDDEEEGNDNGI